MAIEHAQPLDLIVLDPNPESPQHGTVLSTSLLRESGLQLMRLVLPAGHSLPEHHVPGEVTIQCLSGEADVIVPERSCRLRPGTLMMLPPGKPHRVQAQAATVLLVTVVRHPA